MEHKGFAIHRPKNDDPELDALQRVADAINARETEALQDLRNGELPSGWPRSFKRYLESMGAAATSHLEHGDRNTRTGFNGFAAANTHTAHTPAHAPGAPGYVSVMTEVYGGPSTAAEASWAPHTYGSTQADSLPASPPQPQQP